MGAIAEKDFYAENFISTWNDAKIDVLLSPIMPFTAPLAKSDTSLINQLTFTSYQNVLQMPAGSVPIRLVKK